MAWTADHCGPTSRTTYRVEVRAEGDGPPAEVRLKRLLKVALRGYGLRCTDVRAVAQTTTLPVAAAPADKANGGAR